MLKNKLIKIVVLSSLVSPFAHAQWFTNVEDDLFSGGKKAVMMGDLTSSTGAIIFDCTKDKLSAAYVEEDGSTKEVGHIPMDLVLKVDGKDTTKLDASLSRRNAKSVQVSSDDAEKIKPLLKQLQEAKSKVLVGIQTKDGGNQSSFSGNTSGSTAAATSFIKACEIKF